MKATAVPFSLWRVFALSLVLFLGVMSLMHSAGSSTPNQLKVESLNYYAPR